MAQGTFQKREQRFLKPEVKEDFYQTVSSKHSTGCCSHELRVAVTACTKPVQDQTSLKSNID